MLSNILHTYTSLFRLIKLINKITNRLGSCSTTVISKLNISPCNLTSWHACLHSSNPHSLFFYTKACQLTSQQPLPQHPASCTGSLPRPIAPTEHQPARVFCSHSHTHVHSALQDFVRGWKYKHRTTDSQSHGQMQILLGWKTHTAQEYTVSLVSCMSNHHLLMGDIALTSLMTEKACPLCHSRSELGLFHSVKALAPQLLTCGWTGKDSNLKEILALSLRKYIRIETFKSLDD